MPPRRPSLRRLSNRDGLASRPMALTGKQFAISAGDYSATAVEIGGGLRRCTYAGADVLASYGEDELPPKAAGSVLAPWPNRLRGGRYMFAGHAYQLPI